MKQLKRLLIVFLLPVVLLPPEASAFQNYFNVPNSQITQQNRFYFQQQINFTSNNLEGDTDLVYGLGSSWEIGIATNDIQGPSPWHGWDEPDNGSRSTSSLAFGIQKKFDLTERIGLAVGTKNGVALNNGRMGQWTSRGHINWTLNIPEMNSLQIAAGPYYMNGAFLNEDHMFVGIEAGVELPLLYEQIHLMADFLSGSNDHSVIVVGTVLWLSKHGNISLGWQFPWPGSQNSHSFVFEVTLL